jgi:hypothetical protein
VINELAQNYMRTSFSKREQKGGDSNSECTEGKLAPTTDTHIQPLQTYFVWLCLQNKDKLRTKYNKGYITRTSSSGHLEHRKNGNNYSNA